MPSLGASNQDSGLLSVSVDNGHCHLYGLCEQEAPTVFELGDDGRLRYQPHPAEDDLDAVRQAARVCPMQAISLTGGQR